MKSFITLQVEEMRVSIHLQPQEGIRPCLHSCSNLAVYDGPDPLNLGSCMIHSQAIGSCQQLYGVLLSNCYVRLFELKMLGMELEHGSACTAYTLALPYRRNQVGSSPERSNDWLKPQISNIPWIPISRVANPVSRCAVPLSSLRHMMNEPPSGHSFHISCRTHSTRNTPLSLLGAHLKAHLKHRDCEGKKTLRKKG